MSNYSPEHFNRALEALTPPFHGQKDESIGYALSCCNTALDHLPERHKLNPKNARLIAQLEGIMNMKYSDISASQTIVNEIIEIIEVLRFVK